MPLIVLVNRIDILLNCAKILNVISTKRVEPKSILDGRRYIHACLHSQQTQYRLITECNYFYMLNIVNSG